MPAPINITIGSKYGRLVITDMAEQHRHVVCVCDCGEIVTRPFLSLHKGNTRSCGCLRRETTSTKNTTHGKTQYKEYAHWRAMRWRCVPGRKYGIIGISVHPSWNDFDTFLRDVGRMPASNYTLDRFPNRQGNYEPGNVRWATASEQVRNRDCMDTVVYRGEELLVIELAERFGMTSQQLRSRLSNGWSVEKAITTPVAKGNNQHVIK